MVLATELLTGAAAFDWVFVRHPENLTNKFLRRPTLGLSEFVALIVKSQNCTAFPSFSDLCN